MPPGNTPYSLSIFVSHNSFPFYSICCIVIHTTYNSHEFSIYSPHYQFIVKWGPHVDKIHAKAFKRLYFFTCLKRAGVEENELLDYYRSIIRSVVECACPAWPIGITKG